MEKIKSLLSSGGSKDEVRGEGSHFDNERAVGGSAGHAPLAEPAPHAESKQAAQVATDTFQGTPGHSHVDTTSTSGASGLGQPATTGSSTRPGDGSAASATGTHHDVASELAAGHPGAGLTQPQGTGKHENPFFSTGTSNVHSMGPHQNDLPVRSADSAGLGSSTTATTSGSQPGYGAEGTQSGQASSGLASERGDGLATGQGSHFGRDTAVGTAATTSGSQPGYGAAGTQSGQASAGLASERGDGLATGQGSHFGRDAAIGTAAASTGMAAHEHHNHNQGSVGLGSGGVNAPGGINGPHQSAMANLLDPKINPTANTGTENARHHDPGHGGGAEQADSHHGDATQRGSTAHITDSHSTGHGHGARDGAIGVAASGLAAHEIGNRDASQTSHSPGHASTNLQDTSHTSHGTGLGTQPAGLTGTHAGSGGPVSQSYGAPASNLETRAVRDNDTSSRTARNTGLGAGAAGVVGAAGLAEQQHHKHQDPSHATMGSAAQPSSGTHATDSSQHHHGRDAAVATGGGALATHEYQKHHDAGHTTRDTTTQPSSVAHDPNTASKHHHGKDAAAGTGGVALAEHGHKKHHDSTKSTSTDTHPSSKHHDQRGDVHHEKHHGKEAGLAAVGGAAVADHEAYKSATTSSTTGPAPNTSGPHKHDWMNKLDPRVDHKAGIKGESSSAIKDEKHHTGRDAAIAGGAGDAAYNFDDRHHVHRVRDPNDSALTEGDFDAQGNQIPHPHRNAEPALEALEATAGGHHTHGHGSQGIGASGVPEHSARTDRDVHGTHHQAAGGLAAGAAAGAAAGGIAEHHRDNRSNLAHGQGLSEADTDQTGRSITHANSNAAAGLASHQSTVPGHHGGTTASSSSGVAHTQGYTGAHTGLTGQPIQHANANAPGTLEHGERGPLSHDTTGQKSHLGRDAGVLGAAGAVAEHERSKTSGTHAQDAHVAGQPGQSQLGRDQAFVDTTSRDGRKHEGASNTSHSTGATHSERERERELKASSGATGLAEHEQHKHEGIGSSSSAAGRGLGGSEHDHSTGTGLGSSGSTHGRTATDSHGHTKLHKEPPAQLRDQLAGGNSEQTATGVPKNATERENMMQEGQHDMQEDTGVAHATATGGTAEQY